jgi:peptidoglycan/LPS O-acetylase OafA/YrhL
MEGGFTGVDIFFVISGYVITRSMLARKMKGEFSLLGFYESRIRRLFPSLAVVLLVTFGMYYFLTPSDFLDFSDSIYLLSFSLVSIRYTIYSKILI